MAVKHFLCCAAVAALTLASCVYPFEPGIETTDNRIVVEGSISIGDVSTFNFSRVIPFSEADTYYYGSSPSLSITGYIEGEDGTRIEPYQIRDGSSSGSEIETGSADALAGLILLGEEIVVEVVVEVARDHRVEALYVCHSRTELVGPRQRLTQLTLHVR